MKTPWRFAVVVLSCVSVAPAGDTRAPDQKKSPDTAKAGVTAGPRGPDSTATAQAHNDLVRRGVDLIDPHIIIHDRKSSAGGDAERDLREGISYLDRALEIYPGNWGALWFRGKAYQWLGDDRQAYESFHMSYGLNPANVDVGRELSLECLDVGMFDEAVAVAKATVQIAPKDAGVRANLALALLLNRQVDAAKAAVTDALRLDPDDRITKSLRDRIDEVRSGKRPQPNRVRDLVD